MARHSEAVEPGTVWTWNAIGQADGAWQLAPGADESRKGFILNHLISDELPLEPQAGDDGRPGRTISNSDPVTGRAGWYDVRVCIRPAGVDGTAGTDGTSPRIGTTPPAPGVLAGALWYCTAMIYAFLRFVQEWAHPLTLINYTLIGISSGLVLTCVLAALAGEAPLLRAAGPRALVATLAAWLTRTLSLRRNARLRPTSTLQSATGIRSAKLAQPSMGMTGGAFNTREFFHGARLATLKLAKLALIVLGFALPAVFILWALMTGAPLTWVLALLVQAPGLIFERWFFFAQARHPQNLYYQVIS